MRHTFFICSICVLLSGYGFAQEVVADGAKYFVGFTDKNNSPYSIEHPEAYLSDKALERRNRQHIQINTDDLPVNSFYIDSVLAKGVKLCERTKWLNGIVVYAQDTTVMDKVRQLPFVKTVEKNANIKKRVEETESVCDNFPSKLYTPAMGLQRKNDKTADPTIYNYGMAAAQVRMVNGDQLHRLGYCGNGMTIAVFDGGFYHIDRLDLFSHFWEEGRILSICDFTNKEQSVFEKSDHGACVLSIIGSNINGQLIGTAPKANFHLVVSEDERYEYPIEEDNWVCAAEYADSVGADIISSSLGYCTFHDAEEFPRSYNLMDGQHSRASIAATMAAQRGMIVVNSAGNSGRNKWHFIGAPADAKDILAVGAVDSLRKYASFSSAGPSADGRLKPDVTAMGYKTALIEAKGEYIGRANGTSFSAPVISGMTACLWQAFPEKTNYEIMNAIKQSCDRFHTPDSLYGNGIPDYFQAYNILCGKNKLDESQLHLYPNPCGDMLTVTTDIPTQFDSVRIYSMSGKLMLLHSVTDQPNHLNINLSTLPKGMYFVKIYSKDMVVTKKLIKL